MKPSVLPFLLLGCLFASAQTAHYISEKGADANAGTQAAPWKTVAKVVTYVASNSFKPGDKFYFERGGTYYGSLTPLKSGTAASPCVIDAYGTGAQPKITGLKDIVSLSKGGWAKHPTLPGVWCATLAGNIGETETTPASTDMFLVFGLNGKPATIKPRARFPKSDYRTYKATDGANVIEATDATQPLLNSSWNGATAVFRNAGATIARAEITSYNATTGLVKLSKAIESANNGSGWFLINHPNILALENKPDIGDWYWDGGATQLCMYFGADDPARYTVQLPALNFLFYPNSKSYWTVRNVTFEGAFVSATAFRSNYVTIENCHLTLSGKGNVTTNVSNYNRLINDTITNMACLGIRMNGEGRHYLIEGNVFRNIGVFGLYTGDQLNAHGVAINQLGMYGTSSDVADLTIRYNDIATTGSSAIDVRGSKILTEKNLFRDYCVNTEDVAAVYSFTPRDTATMKAVYGRVFRNNIVLAGHSQGNKENSMSAPASRVHAFYSDVAPGLEILNNYVEGVPGYALHNFGGSRVKFQGNIIVNACLNNDAFGAINFQDNGSWPIRGCDVSGNVVLNNNRAVLKLSLSTRSTDYKQFGVFRQNFYRSSAAYPVRLKGVGKLFPTWLGLKVDSGSVLQATGAEVLTFYNAGRGTVKTIALPPGRQYRNLLTGGLVSGTVSLGEYESVALLYVAAIPVPTAPPPVTPTPAPKPDTQATQKPDTSIAQTPVPTTPVPTTPTPANPAPLLPAPALVTFSAIKKDRVDISAPAVSGSNGFNIYKAVGKVTGTYTRIAEKVTAFPYRISNLSTSTPYFFKLATVNKDGKEGPQSVPFAVTTQPEKNKGKGKNKDQ